MFKILVEIKLLRLGSYVHILKNVNSHFQLLSTAFSVFPISSPIFPLAISAKVKDQIQMLLYLFFYCTSDTSQCLYRSMN